MMRKSLFEKAKLQENECGSFFRTFFIFFVSLPEGDVVVWNSRDVLWGIIKYPYVVT
jgi:hypothetical protein